MLYFNFKNYEGFKALFGKRIANNGKVVRSNGILLSFLKHEFKCKRFDNLNFCSLDVLYGTMISELGYSSNNLANDMHLYHPDYDIDICRGVCEDGDTRCIRYIRTDNERVFKMKAGKFLRLVLEHHGFIGKYCEQFTIYMCERFAEEWSSFVESNYGTKYELHVDDKFYKIYDSYYCKGCFDSCMTNNGQYSFYENAVNASAAYLTDEDDKIVARCVIFNEVHNKNTGKILRLAERQYATDQDNVLKQILIDKLIQGGHIDGYKKVGVDCHSPQAFVLNDGTSLEECKLWICCDLDYDSILSYQDSFKWYDMVMRRADNYAYGDYDLATADSRLDGSEHDDYHDYYCREVRIVHVWNSHYDDYNEYHCNVDDMGDFEYCERYCRYYNEAYLSRYEDDYIPRNEAVFSDYLNDYLWDDLSTWCDEMQDYLPDDDFDYYFDKWKKDNWEWDDLNNEYVKETVKAYIWNDSEYDEHNVGVEYAEQYLEMYDGEYYSVLNEDGIPFHLVEELEECEAV